MYCIKLQYSIITIHVNTVIIMDIGIDHDLYPPVTSSPGVEILQRGTTSRWVGNIALSTPLLVHGCTPLFSSLIVKAINIEMWTFLDKLPQRPSVLLDGNARSESWIRITEISLFLKVKKKKKIYIQKEFIVGNISTQCKISGPYRGEIYLLQHYYKMFMKRTWGGLYFMRCDSLFEQLVICWQWAIFRWGKKKLSNLVLTGDGRENMNITD